MNEPIHSRVDNSFLQQRAFALWAEGQKHQFKGNLEQAIDLYTKSLTLYPTAEAYTYRGWAYSLKKDYARAIDECRKAIETDPTFGNPYNDIGSYLFSQGKLDDALSWFEKAKKASRYEPRHFPYMNLGRVYAAKGLYLRAAHEFEQALKIKPGDRICKAILKELRKLIC